jgi:peptide chain release factor 3
VFRPLETNDVILGAVGVLQFDVVAHRLKSEYGVDCRFEGAPVAAARWVDGDPAEIERFKKQQAAHLAYDAGGDLTYLAPNKVNLDLTVERWPDLTFRATREH